MSNKADKAILGAGAEMVAEIHDLAFELGEADPDTWAAFEAFRDLVEVCVRFDRWATSVGEDG